MARYRRHRRSNPDLMGHDIVDLGWEAAGLAGTAVANDKIVAPLVRQVLPGIFAGGAMAKIADAVTTAFSAWGLGTVVGFIDRSVGRKLERGGLVLTVGKGISVVVPNFSISGSLPISLPQLTGGNGKKQLPEGSANGAANIQTRLGVGSMGL